MKNLKVKDFMTPDPQIISEIATLKQAAWEMKNNDCGFLPVGRKEEIVGVITDRDIVIRAISQGFEPEKARVIDFMTNEIYACNENDFLEDAIEKMRQHDVSRLVVKNKDHEAIGVISFGGIMRKRAETSEVANIVKHATRLQAY